MSVIEDNLDLKLDKIQYQSDKQFEKSSQLFMEAAKKLEEAYKELNKTMDLLKGLDSVLEKLKCEILDHCGKSENILKNAEISCSRRSDKAKMNKNEVGISEIAVLIFGLLTLVITIIMLSRWIRYHLSCRYSKFPKDFKITNLKVRNHEAREVSAEDEILLPLIVDDLTI